MDAIEQLNKILKANYNCELVDSFMDGKFISYEFIGIIKKEHQTVFVLDVSSIDMYTISIINLNLNEISAYLVLSPNSINYKKIEVTEQSINPKEMELFVSPIFSKYVGVTINGMLNNRVKIFLQGQIK